MLHYLTTKISGWLRTEYFLDNTPCRSFLFGSIREGRARIFWSWDDWGDYHFLPRYRRFSPRGWSLSLYRLKIIYAHIGNNGTLRYNNHSWE